MTLPLQQSPHFAAALAAYGADLASTAPVILQRRVGPWGRIDFASRVQASQLTKRPRIVNAETPDHARWRALGYRQIITPVHIAEWDLTGDLRAKLSSKWRNRLNRAERAGLKITLSPWDGGRHPLFDHADAMARARRYRALPTRLLAAYATGAPGHALLAEAHLKGGLCAAALILRHGISATYQTAWSNALGQSTDAARAVLFAAAKHLCDTGTTLFDLGPVDTENAKGLARFKLGTGANPRPLGGTWLRLS